MSSHQQAAHPPRNLHYPTQARLDGDGVQKTGPVTSALASVSFLPRPSEVSFGEGPDDGYGVDHSAKALELEFERLSRQLEEERVEAEARLCAAVEHAREEGRLVANREAEASVNGALEQIHSLLRALEEKALRYTEQVEREVVILALSIAARILRHESQVDRLLVAGAVRATLDAMRQGGKVKVRVPQQDLAAWQMHLEKICFEGKQVSVEGDSTMKAGECLCEFTTGRLDLGIAGQLGEIERAFENILGRGNLPGNNNAFRSGMQDRATSNA